MSVLSWRLISPCVTARDLSVALFQRVRTPAVFRSSMAAKISAAPSSHLGATWPSTALSTCAYGLESESEDVWVAHRGVTRVRQVVQYLPPEGDRVERVISHVTVRTPRGVREIDSVYGLLLHPDQEDALDSRLAAKAYNDEAEYAALVLPPRELREKDREAWKRELEED